MPDDPTPDQTTIIEIKHRFDPNRIPHGWTVEPIRWDGRDLEIGVDGRYQVMRFRPGGDSVETDGAASAVTRTQHRSEVVDATTAERLTEAGWRNVVTDTDGQQLWTRPRALAATAQLDRLRTGPPGAAPSLSVA